MCRKRLGWEPLPLASSDNGLVFAVHDAEPFANPSDYRILLNDWPYESLNEDITHLVVWLKMRIPEDPTIGALTCESKALIQKFVDEVFVQRLGKEATSAEERVVWFKNYSALQSVKWLERIHVLVQGLPRATLLEWTGETESQ